MENIMNTNTLYFFITLISVAIVVIGGIYITRKFKIERKDLQISEMTLELLNYINDSYSLINEPLVKTVISYSLEAIKLLENDKTKYLTLNEKKNLIFEETIKICKERNIAIDEKLIGLVNKVLDFLIDNGKLTIH